MTLLFSEKAQRQFDPVAQQFGLVCVACTEWGVRYENDQVFLNINFDNGRSYELGIEIGQQDPRYPGPPFSLAEVLRLRNIQDAAFVSELLINDDARMLNVLARLSELIVRHASDFLKGNDFSFAQVEKLRSKESAEFELASELRYAKSIVDAAWSARDYEAIVKVLGPLEPHLSRAEKKRLDYSRQHFHS